MSETVIKPQPGYQTKALSSSADIVIGGGSAGSGKSWALLLDPLRYIHIPYFNGVVFRRTSPQIRASGGLWDTSMGIYRHIHGATPVDSRLEWRFGDPDKAVTIKFSHLEYEKNIFDWQGSEITYLAFDELTHFTKKMFFYMLSRNRSTCGVKPLVRATCNPDPDSWVAEFISWWIGPDGYPIPERQGVIRYFMVDNDNYIWGDTYEEVIEKGWHVLEPMVEKSGIDPKEFIKSLTFIGGSIYDNKELLTKNPGYLGNLNAQDEATKSQLLRGNWKVKVSHSDIYDFFKFADIFTNVHVKKNIDAAKEILKRIPYAYTKAQIDDLKKLTKKCITADIALKGSDKFVALAWEGKMLIDFVVYDKSAGNVVVNAIKGLAIRHGIPNSDITFDNDGLGAFVDGFIQGAVEFKNNARAVNHRAYANMKSECYFMSGDAVGRGEYYVPEEYGGRLVATRLVDDTRTLKDMLLRERKAIKRDKPDNDGKLRVIPKQEMKPYLNGNSPDYLDAFMMREAVDLITPKYHSTDDSLVSGLNY